MKGSLPRFFGGGGYCSRCGQWLPWISDWDEHKSKFCYPLEGK